MKQEILVVDDEPDLVKLVTEVLREADFSVSSANNADETMRKIRESKPDLILLDLKLPVKDGFDICRTLKSDDQTSAIPVIILSSKKTEADKVLGLELGADDYITKPFRSAELVARLKAVIRRMDTKGEKEKIVCSGKLVLDLDSHSVMVKDKPIKLTPKEFDLLYTLLKKKNKVVSRAYLMESIWGYEYYGTTRTVDVHIRHLRYKLGVEGRRIETVESYGYRFAEE
ncbi:MAG: response regulator transcription factor [Elusimicrobiota bacterium]